MLSQPEVVRLIVGLKLRSLRQARGLSYQRLALWERPFETIMSRPISFDVVLNNFKTSYFPAALLIPEAALAE